MESTLLKKQFFTLSLIVKRTNKRRDEIINKKKQVATDHKNIKKENKIHIPA